MAAILSMEGISQLVGSMENNFQNVDGSNKAIGSETKLNSNIKSISLSGDKWVISDELPGVYCDGIQYYDLKDITFLNNTGFANLIDLLKSLLGKGVEVQFVNVNERIKNKIKSLGLDHILNCG
ncbi:MAG: STAS domain-containing protein [Bacteroidota bacterium]|nr:STAS domain-containing protein [Bacteroidota bacterium]